MEPVITLSALMTLGKVVGTVMTLIGIPIGAMKIINWVKTKFINIDANVTALKATMEVGFDKLNENIQNQTTTIATELKEQRADFRTFYAPTLLMMQQAAAITAPSPTPVRAKRSPRRKIKKKA